MAAAGRAALADLLQEHGRAIQELREELAADLAHEPPAGEVLSYDEIWLLRYVISFAGSPGRGGAPAAAAAARKALAWRRENIGLIVAAAARRPPPSVDTRTLAVIEHTTVLGYHGVSRMGDLILLVRSGVSQSALLMQTVPPEKVEIMLTYLCECGYQYLDTVSRQRGYLVKTITINDFAGADAVNMLKDRRFLKAFANTAKRHEWLYPQREMKRVLIRPPRLLDFLWNYVLKPLVPRSIAEKLIFHSHLPDVASAADVGCDLQACPFASQLLQPSQLPRHLGGTGDAVIFCGLPLGDCTPGSERRVQLPELPDAGQHDRTDTPSFVLGLPRPAEVAGSQEESIASPPRVPTPPPCPEKGDPVVGRPREAHASLSVLLDQHAEAVRQLQAELATELAAPRPSGEVLEYDEVWLLRYVLSYVVGKGRGGLQAAAAAARKALAWRRENAALVAAAAARRPPPGLDTRYLAAFDLFCVSGFHTVSKQGDPIYFTRFAACDVPLLMKTVTAAEVELMATYVAECAYQFLDYTSRQRGYMVKTINITDLAASSLLQDGRFTRGMSSASKRHEWLYPQRDMKMVLFNAPRWVAFIVGMLKGFMPRSTMEKVHFHNLIHDANGQEGCDLKRCPFASQLLEYSDLPKHLWGADAATALAEHECSFRNWSERHKGEVLLLPLPGSFDRKEAPTSVAQLPRVHKGAAGNGTLKLPLAMRSIADRQCGRCLCFSSVWRTLTGAAA